jgi:hypothetical protein
MTYESHPTTEWIASHCCLCGRPLVDPDSIERGIGPICLDKVGDYAESAGEADLSKVASLVAQINNENLTSKVEPALQDGSAYTAARVLLHYVSLATSRRLEDPQVLIAIAAIKACGYDRLAKAVHKAAAASGLVQGAEIRIYRDGDFLVVQAPYSDAALPAWRALRAKPFDSARKANVVKADNKRALWGLLIKFYPGKVGEAYADFTSTEPENTFEVPRA